MCGVGFSSLCAESQRDSVQPGGLPALLLLSLLCSAAHPRPLHARPALARAGSDARLLAEQLPAPCDQLISFLCYYYVVMVNLPTPPIGEGRMGEAVIRGNLIRSCFISSGSPTPSSTVGVHCLGAARGKPSAQRGPCEGWGCSVTALPWLEFLLPAVIRTSRESRAPPGFAGQ